MEYLPYATQGIYGAVTFKERAAYYASRGLINMGGTPLPAWKDGLYMMIDVAPGIVYLKQL